MFCNLIGSHINLNGFFKILFGKFKFSRGKKSQHVTFDFDTSQSECLVMFYVTFFVAIKKYPYSCLWTYYKPLQPRNLLILICLRRQTSILHSPVVPGAVVFPGGPNQDAPPSHVLLSGKHGAHCGL